MNLDDLTSVLRDRADHLPDVPAGLRIAGVRSHVRATRRRRAVTGALCLVLVVVGAVYTLIAPTARVSEPAIPTPEYHQGTRILARASLENPVRALTVAFVPQSSDLTVFAGCSENLYLSLAVNGKTVADVQCAAGDTASRSDWKDYGVHAGSPTTLVVTVADRNIPDPSAESGFTSAPIADDMAVTIAVGEAVAPSEYPFPPRPAELPPLLPPLADASTVVRSDPADPDLTRQATWTWTDRHRFAFQATTPGRLRVLVNGRLAFEWSSWDYEARRTTAMFPSGRSELGPLPAEGEQVTVTVIPEGIAGEWGVELPAR